MSTPETSGRAKKRLALFFDGTWNDPGDNTNVWRLKLMLASHDRQGAPQIAYYDPGVGTGVLDRFSGGAFGVGLSENVRHAYRWLMEHYDENDEIYLFGFSRGAFTARSLAGLIARCGLLKPSAPLSFKQVYERYQQGDAVATIYQLKYFNKTPANLEEEVLKSDTHYKRYMIKMVGVWDTVGSIGLPIGNFPGISSRTLRFHNTRLSKIVEHSYHALALDEYRSPYWAVLWTHWLHKQPKEEDKDPADDNRWVEQRWFAGAHSNVGGGYRDDLLPQRPLDWIQRKAIKCDLNFRSTLELSHTWEDDLHIPPVDSYSKFLAGIWSNIRKPYIRWVQSDPVEKIPKREQTPPARPGWVHTVNERVDYSVFRRCALHPEYCSRSLNEWLERKQLDLKHILANPKRYEHLWSPVSQPGIEPAVNLATS